MKYHLKVSDIMMEPRTGTLVLGGANNDTLLRPIWTHSSRVFTWCAYDRTAPRLIPTCLPYFLRTSRKFMASGSKTRQRCCLWKKFRYSLKQWYLSSASASFNRRSNSSSFKPVCQKNWNWKFVHLLKEKSQRNWQLRPRVRQGLTSAVVKRILWREALELKIFRVGQRLSVKFLNLDVEKKYKYLFNHST